MRFSSGAGTTHMPSILMIDTVIRCHLFSSGCCEYFQIMGKMGPDFKDIGMGGIWRQGFMSFLQGGGCKSGIVVSIIDLCCHIMHLRSAWVIPTPRCIMDHGTDSVVFIGCWLGLPGYREIPRGDIF